MADLPPDLPPPPPPLPPPPSDAFVRSRRSPYLPGSRWTGRRFFGLLAAWLAGGIVGGMVAYGLGYDPAVEPIGLAITVVSQAGAAFAVVLAGSSDLGRDIGLRFHVRDSVGILWGLGLQVGAALLVSPLVRLLSDDSQTQQQVADIAESTSDVAGRLILVAMFVIVAPFIEEVIFRGAMMGWLARRMRIGWAVTISAAAFAAVHLADPNAVLAVPSLFVIGVALGWAAYTRGNITISIMMHAGVNLLGAIVLIWGDTILRFLEDAQQNLESLGTLLGIR